MTRSSTQEVQRAVVGAAQLYS